MKSGKAKLSMASCFYYNFREFLILFYTRKQYFFPNFRDGNVFDVRANIAPGETVIYRLTYEQLLKRKLSMYEHKININPKYEH